MLKVDLFEKAEIIHHELFEYEIEDGSKYLFNSETQDFFVVDKIKGILSINIDEKLKTKIMEKYKGITPAEAICLQE